MKRIAAPAVSLLRKLVGPEDPNSVWEDPAEDRADVGPFPGLQEDDEDHGDRYDDVQDDQDRMHGR